MMYAHTSGVHCQVDERIGLLSPVVLVAIDAWTTALETLAYDKV